MTGGNTSRFQLSSLELVIVTSHRVYDTLGGIEKFVSSFSSWCQTIGVEVTTISRELSLSPIRVTHGPVSLQRNERIRYVRKISLPLLLYYVGLCFFSFSTFKELLGLIKKSRILQKKALVIHSQDLNFAAIPVVLAGKILHTPTIVHQHGPYMNILRSRKMKLIELSINKIACKFSSVIICTDKCTESYLMKIKGQNKEISVVPTAVDTKLFESLTHNNSDPGCCRIGFVGRLSPEKNLDTLLRAFKIFEAKANRSSKLILVGDGELRTPLKQLARNLGIYKMVDFVGFQIDIRPVLFTIDIFVLPSLTEGTPITLFEAMASGRAIISSRIPTIQEIVEDGKDALLFDPYKPEELAERMLFLCSNPESTKTLKQNAKVKSAKFDENEIYPLILEKYRNALSIPRT